VAPTRDELANAYGRTVPDLVRPGLRWLLVGVNPSLWSAWSGHHFASPTNRLWKVLHRAGFMDRQLQPHETDAILAAGVGITNFVERATVSADEVGAAELRAGLGRLAELVERCQPNWVVPLGLTAYRAATLRRRAQVGRQPDQLGGRPVWLLPNPSGRAAAYSPADLTELYAQLRRSANSAPAQRRP
jgi:TDG/mug DNA glycosylase family protein